MARLAIAALAIYAVIATLLWLSCAGDPVETLVSNASAPRCVPLVNPCAAKSCEVKVDTRSMT